MQQIWENEGLRKILDEARAMFASFYDALIAHAKSQKQCSADGVPAISECQDTIMKEGDAELHSARMEFAKLQAKQQPTRDDSGPSFSLTSTIVHPDS